MTEDWFTRDNTLNVDSWLWFPLSQCLRRLELSSVNSRSCVTLWKVFCPQEYTRCGIVYWLWTTLPSMMSYHALESSKHIPTVSHLINVPLWKAPKIVYLSRATGLWLNSTRYWCRVICWPQLDLAKLLRSDRIRTEGDEARSLIKGIVLFNPCSSSSPFTPCAHTCQENHIQDEIMT